jgi:hypothetical protein
MSDVTISIFPSKNPRKDFQLHAYLAGGTTGSVSSSNVLDMTGLTRTCQQVYMETRLLPFQAITFHIHSDGSFVNFIDMLPEAERDAISTVQLSAPDANIGASLYHSVENSFRNFRNDENSQRCHLDFLEWKSDLGLDRLGGLKQILVEANSQWFFSRASDGFLRAGIGSCVKGRDVTIVIPKPT